MKLIKSRYSVGSVLQLLPQNMETQLMCLIIKVGTTNLCMTRARPDLIAFQSKKLFCTCFPVLQHMRRVPSGKRDHGSYNMSPWKDTLSVNTVTKQDFKNMNRSLDKSHVIPSCTYFSQVPIPELSEKCRSQV